MAGRPRKIKTAKEMEELWNQYLNDCRTKTAYKTVIDKNTMQPVNIEMLAPVTPKIIGFCSDYLNMTSENFYMTYANNELFSIVIKKIKEDCERCSVECFEQGQIDSKLAGLLLSKYGYSTQVKQDVSADATIKVDLTGELENYAI